MFDKYQKIGVLAHVITVFILATDWIPLFKITMY